MSIKNKKKKFGIKKSSRDYELMMKPFKVLRDKLHKGKEMSDVSICTKCDGKTITINKDGSNRNCNECEGRGWNYEKPAGTCRTDVTKLVEMSDLEKKEIIDACEKGEILINKAKDDVELILGSPFFSGTEEKFKEIFENKKRGRPRKT